MICDYESVEILRISAVTRAADSTEVVGDSMDRSTEDTCGVI